MIEDNYEYFNALNTYFLYYTYMYMYIVYPRCNVHSFMYSVSSDVTFSTENDSRQSGFHINYVRAHGKYNLGQNSEIRLVTRARAQRLIQYFYSW